MVCMLLHSQLRLFVARYSLWFPKEAIHELPTCIDPWPHATRIATIGPLSCIPASGIWSAQQAVAPMVVALYYFAASGNWYTQESRKLRDFVEGEHPGNQELKPWFRGIFSSTQRSNSSADIIPQAEMVAVAQDWYGLRIS